jgi:hypothetical protein
MLILANIASSSQRYGRKTSGAAAKAKAVALGNIGRLFRRPIGAARVLG